MWQLLADEKGVKERLETERNHVKPDKEMIESLRGQPGDVRDEIRNLKPSKPNIKVPAKLDKGSRGHSA